FHCEASKQEIVANGVNEPGQALGAKMNFRDQFRAENGLLTHTGLCQARSDIFPGFVRLKRPQRASKRDTLFQLAELRRFQLAIEFRLAGENDLDKLAAAALEI